MTGLPKTDAVKPANPYTAPPAAEPKPAGDGTTPQPKKLAGKFENEIELEKGYVNQQTVLTERNNQLRATEQRVKELEQMLVGVADRMSPAGRTAERSRAEKLLEATGVPVEALREFFADEAETKVPKAVERTLAPMIQGNQMRETLAEEFPDVDPNDVAQFLRANPEIGARYAEKLGAGKVSDAWYYAFAQYNRAGGGRDLSGLAEQQARARRDAALPDSVTPADRRSPASKEAATLADTYERYLETGNKSDFLRTRLAGVISGIKPQAGD